MGTSVSSDRKAACYRCDSHQGSTSVATRPDSPVSHKQVGPMCNQKEQRRKNMKTNYGMETDPSPQVRSTTGRRIIWPTRLLNIGLIDGFEHSFNDWDVLTQEKLILWPFLAPPSKKELVMSISLTIAPPKTLGKS